MLGIKFRRQHPLGPYIADFVCLKMKVIIELDGPIHEERKAYDANRDRWLRSEGYAILRFKNEELEKNKLEVLRRLRKILLYRMGFK